MIKKKLKKEHLIRGRDETGERGFNPNVVNREGWEEEKKKVNICWSINHET